MLAKSVALDASTDLFSPKHGPRVLPLDGLRGLLALGVFVNHAAIYRTYPATGMWSTDSAFCAMLGQLGVSLFFMITAFLFYGRLIDEGGRPDWHRLYIGRFFRIAPVYLLAILALFIFVMCHSFRLQVPPVQLAGELAAWLMLGAGPRVDLNGFADTRHLLAGVTWTLQSEWLFYASLPLLALAPRLGRRLAFILPLVGFVAVLGFLTFAAPTGFPACVAPFLAGMLCAALPKPPRSPVWQASLFVVGVLVFFAVTAMSPRAPFALLLQTVVFYILVSGCSVFGLLTGRVVRWLGALSYPVYLLHGLLLALAFSLGDVRVFAEASAVRHWFVILCMTGPLLLVGHLAHVLVEEPGIRLGRVMTRATGGRPGSMRPSEQPSPLAARLMLAPLTFASNISLLIGRAKPGLRR